MRSIIIFLVVMLFMTTFYLTMIDKPYSDFGDESNEDSNPTEQP